VQVVDFTHDVQTQPDPIISADLIGQTIGGFRVQRLLGEGGTGAVYLAEHEAIGTRVAIKVLTGDAAYRDDLRTRLIREARATNTISSPHVPRYYDFGQLPDGRAFTTVEYYEGETLRCYMNQRGGKLTLGDAIDILLQVCDGMCAAHAVDVIHRDLKPENLMLLRQRSARSHVIILDFGVAKLLKPTVIDGDATGIGVFIGTPLYCAPEQVFGAAVGPACDVYALGVLAYELLSGKRPFDGDGMELLGKKVSTDAPSVAAVAPELPQAIVDDIAAMLARDSKARVQTMDDVRQRIERWAKHAAPFDAPTVIARPIDPSPSPSPSQSPFADALQKRAAAVNVDDIETKKQPKVSLSLWQQLPALWRQPRTIAITIGSLVFGFAMAQLIV